MVATSSGIERKCPFCSTPIDEDVLLYGGSCPKCFGVIPGEEAATDPGAVVRARQAASDQRRMWVKALIPVALAVPAVGAVFVIALGFVIWNRNPTVETMNFDEDGVGIEFDIVSAPPEPEIDPDAVKVERPRPTGGTAEQVNGLDRPPEIRVQNPQPGSTGLNFGGLGVQTFREGEVLSDPAQIFQMVKLRMTSYQGQLRECYERRLKAVPELEGRWRASFVVGTDGFPKEVRFTGQKMKDAELEQCLAGKVSRWKFNRIAQPQPVEKSWNFRPG